VWVQLRPPCLENVVVGNWCQLEASCKSLPFSILIGWLGYGVLVVPADDEYISVEICNEH
jgi:hypothetical protein